MERILLAQARARKHWTLKDAAGRLGVNANTVLRWEKGLAAPHAYNIQQLCDVYQATASDLGLESAVSVGGEVPAARVDPTVSTLMKHDLTMHLLTLVFEQRTHQEIQRRVRQILEDYDSMNTTNKNHNVTRRKALRRLITFPFAGALYLNVPEIDHRSDGETVAKCAAGIVACWELSKSTEDDDLALSFHSVSSYIPRLNVIARDSSQYRKAATDLLAQCYLFKTVLGWHLEGLDRAMEYGLQAMQYVEEADDLPLQITIHMQLSWLYYYAKHYKRSFEEIQQAAYLLKHSRVPLPPALHASVQGTLAIRQAMHGHHQQALTSVRLAHERFFSSNTTDMFISVDYGQPSLVLEDGMAYAHLGLQREALDSFEQIIDPESLSSKMPVSGRTRVEILNNQVLSLLKSPQKDMEKTIHVWTAAIQEATRLRSSQRFSEALLNYEIMGSVWPGEKRIAGLRDLVVHW